MRGENVSAVVIPVSKGLAQKQPLLHIAVLRDRLDKVQFKDDVFVHQFGPDLYQSVCLVRIIFYDVCFRVLLRNFFPFPIYNEYKNEKGKSMYCSHTLELTRKKDDYLLKQRFYFCWFFYFVERIEIVYQTYFFIFFSVWCML